jgi:hypothetical protein
MKLLTTVGIAMALSCLPAVTSAQSKKQLEQEVAQLKQDVDPLVIPRLESAGIKVDVAMAPVERFFAFVQTLAPEKRRVTWEMTSAAGQLLEWHDECKVFGIKVGDLAAFAEFNGGNVNGGGFVFRPQDGLEGIQLRTLSAVWDAPQRRLTVRVAASADFFLPMIRLFLDLDCFGGGIELGKVGPFTLKTNARVDAPLGVGLGSSQLFSANAPLHLNGDAELCTSFGSIGTLCIRVQQAATIDLAWEFGGPVTSLGSIVVPTGSGQPITRNYELNLSRRVASTWVRGYSLAVTPSIVWRP